MALYLKLFYKTNTIWYKKTNREMMMMMMNWTSKKTIIIIYNKSQKAQINNRQEPQKHRKIAIPRVQWQLFQHLALQLGHCRFYISSFPWCSCYLWRTAWLRGFRTFRSQGTWQRMNGCECFCVLKFEVCITLYNYNPNGKKSSKRSVKYEVIRKCQITLPNMEF